MALIIVYTTYPNTKTAKKITSYLIQKRLIACANLFPISSSYWWKGKVCKSKEIAGILKTRKELFAKICKEIKKQHPYEVPCIEKITFDAEKKFKMWIYNETKA